MNTSAHPDLEVVLVAPDDETHVDEVERVTAWLSAHLTSTWAVTVAGAQIDRQQLRQRWQSSPSTVVAFVDLDPTGDLDAVLRPLTAIRAAAPENTGLLSRRTALFTLGGAGLAVLLASCGRSSSSGATTTTTTAAAGASAGSKPVPLAAEMTEGPYYLDLNLVRHDITEDRTGAPLSLDLVVATTAGAAVQGAAVDIWHCDANGLYSGFVSASAGANRSGAATTADDGTFLRGTQITDGSGKVSFKTIYPGWYTGRTVHIHVKVHASGRTVHTGQLFFDDAFTDTVFASTTPYSARPTRDTRNARDGIYSGGGSSSVLDVKRSGNAYAATMTMGVKTT